MTHKYERKFRLWPNKNRKSETHPNLTGDIIIDGTAYWLNAWVNVDDNGEKTISGSVGKAKVDKPVMDTAEQSAPDLDDTIPF